MSKKIIIATAMTILFAIGSAFASSNKNTSLIGVQKKPKPAAHADPRGSDERLASGKTGLRRRGRHKGRRHHGKGVTSQSTTNSGKRKSQPPDPLVRRRPGQ